MEIQDGEIYNEETMVEASPIKAKNIEITLGDLIEKNISQIIFLMNCFFLLFIVFLFLFISFITF